MARLGGRLKGLISVCVMLVAAFTTTGCFDKAELEDQAFVPSLGIDKGPNGTLLVTVRIDIPAKIGTPLTGGGGGGGGGGKQQLGGAAPITVQARSLPEALTLLNAGVERKISLTHLSAVMFGEGLARDGLLKVLRPMTRYREFRRTTYLLIAKGTAREVFANNQPVLEKSVTRLIEDYPEVSHDLSVSPVTQFQNFLINLETKNEDPLAPIVAVNKSTQKTGPKSASVLEKPSVTYEPGQVHRIGGDPQEFIGAALFRGDRMIDILDGQQTRYLLMMRGNVSGAMMHFPDIHDHGKYVNVLISKARTPTTKVDTRSKRLKLEVDVPMEAELIGEEGSTDYSNPANAEALSQLISAELSKQLESLMDRLVHQQQTDPIGLARSARGQFATHQQLRQYPWREKLKTAELTVRVSAKVRRIGVQLQPAGL